MSSSVPRILLEAHGLATVPSCSAMWSRTELILCVTVAVQVHSLHVPSTARPSYAISRLSMARLAPPILRIPSATHEDKASVTREHLQHASGNSGAEASAVPGTATRRRFASRRLLFLLPLALLAPLRVHRLFAGAHALWVAYEVAAISQPLITKSATSGVAYFLGDVIAQGQTQTQSDDTARSRPWWRGINVSRLTAATIAGAISHGPQLHYWTLLLERSGLPLLGKVALDQTAFSLYLNAAFCVSTELMQRRPLRAALVKARAAARPCLIAGWKFWPFAHALTYSVVPLHLRVLWVDALEVAWVAILSKTVARSKACPNTHDTFTREEEGAEVAAEGAVTEEAKEDLQCDHVLTCELPLLKEEEEMRHKVQKDHGEDAYEDEHEELCRVVSQTGSGGIRSQVGGADM